MVRLLIAYALLVGVFMRSVRADDTKPSDVEARLAEVEAELVRMRASSEAKMDSDIATDTKEPAFRLYGFIDMGLQKLWATAPGSGDPVSTTFVLGNVNLYFDFHPAQDWSSLIEVRLTNYPQGAIETTAPDPGNGIDSSVRWGAIVLERAYIEWHKLDYLTVRVGEFLTPYGIWNVDHGTPTLIALFRPESVTEELWPTHQLGIEVSGMVAHVGTWFLHYNAYVSNGRTAGVVDLTDDKMIGGRLELSTSHPRRMTFGLSAMHGTFRDQPDPSMPAVSNTETGVAVDGSVDLGGWRLRSELTTRRLRAVPTMPRWRHDAYVLAAYRIPATRFEPYLYIEADHNPFATARLEASSSIGMNVYFTPAIQLKAQYSHRDFLHTDLPGPHDTEDLLAVKLVMGL